MTEVSLYPATCAVCYPVAPGVQGGLGHHAREVVEASGRAFTNVTALGPAPAVPVPSTVSVFGSPPPAAAWHKPYNWRRYFQGAAQLESDRAFGRWLSTSLDPDVDGFYVFTQIGLELLTRYGGSVRHVLDNPNGHIRDYREAVQREADLWLPTPYPAHPTEAMVRRVEEEFSRAQCVRVASTWASRSMQARGIASEKIAIVPHGIDAEWFSGETTREPAVGSLRVLFVGNIALAKGFQYLLSAAKRLASRSIAVRFVGSTGDPWCRRLFENLSTGLNVTMEPGDPRPAYRDCDVVVLPTLHDGFGYVVAEAMACGRPVITTDRCGAAEWIRHGESGWVIPAGDIDALATALDGAAANRGDLRDRGIEARRDAERLAIASMRPALVTLMQRQLTGASAGFASSHAVSS